ncbi:MAG: tetratricopeptide repeat protein [Planctomycetota bacterium]
MERASLTNARAILLLRAERRWSQKDLMDAAGVDIATVRRAESGERVARGSIERLAHALAVSEQQISYALPVARGHAWVPRTPSRFFVGRERILQRLATLLVPRDPVPFGALVGVAGGGKSEIALQYIYRHPGQHEWMLWIDATTPESALDSMRGIAGRLGVRLHGSRLDDIAPAAFRALRERHGWLLVLDGLAAETQPSWTSLVPRSGTAGSVLITTTDREALWPGVVSLRVPTLPEADAAEFLMLRGGRTELLWDRADARGAATAPSSNRDEEAATRELSRSLGHLPAALEAAGAFVSVRRCSFTTYLQDHHARFRVPIAVRSVWRCSLAAVDRASPAAGQLFRLLVLSGAAPIPGSMMGALASAATRGGNDDVAIMTRPLLRYSLLEHFRSKDRYALQPLTREAIRSALPRADRARLEGTFCKVLMEQFPSVPLEEQLALVPHARRAIEYGRRRSLGDPEFARLVRSVGLHALLAGDLHSAEVYLRQALRQLRAAHGPNHPDIARTMNNLGAVHGQLGEHGKAKQRFAAATRAIARTPGLPPESLAETLNNRAITAIHLGEFRSAERFLATCLRSSTGLGSARYLDNYGVLCEVMHRHDEALAHYQAAIRIRTEAGTGQGFELAHCYNNLGKLLLRRGRHAEAEGSLHAAAKRWRAGRGRGQLGLASTLNNLGELYLETGRLRRASQCLREALTLRHERLPPQHRHIALSLVNLARWTVAAAGPRSEVLALTRRARGILDQVGYDEEVAAPLTALRAVVRGKSAALTAMLQAVGRLPARRRG